MRSTVSALLLILLTGCSLAYARLTYDFVPFADNGQVLYEPGAEHLAKRVAEDLVTAIDRVEERHHIPFKDKKAITVYVFDDRKRYARFSHASILTRGSSTTNEVYLSARLRDKPETLANILVHELSHVHIRQYTGTWRYIRDIPGWFLEGEAVLVSSGAGAERVTDDQARAAIRQGVHFEADCSGGVFGHRHAHDFGLEPHMYYRQAGLFVEHLERSDPAAFRATVADVLNGVRFADAWQKHYGRTVSELWVTYVDNIGS